MYEVKDKVFLITGGAAGIGEASVRAVLEEGAQHVAILDLNAKTGIALEKELVDKYGPEKVKFHQCDVTTDHLIEVYDGVFNQQGYIDVVVNSAGILNDSPDMFVRCVALNVTALFKSSFKAYNIMSKHKGGKGGTIINFSSIAALVAGQPGLPVYNATKSAVLKFSNNLGTQQNFVVSGVRVIALCFGSTRTAMLNPNLLDTFDEAAKQDYLKRVNTVPLQTPDNAARGLVHALKHAASASTWLVMGDRPAEDITDDVTEACKIMSRRVTDQ